MLFRCSAFYFFIISFVTSCQYTNSRKDDGLARQKATPSSVNADSVDSSFHQFLERFNKDSTFQFQRILFPLKTKQYTAFNDSDTLFYKQRDEFKRVVFQNEGLVGEHSEWKQNIMHDSSGKRATVEIRGIDNGIMMNYLFEIRDGKWMLIYIDDSST